MLNCQLIKDSYASKVGMYKCTILHYTVRWDILWLYTSKVNQGATFGKGISAPECVLGPSNVYLPRVTYKNHFLKFYSWYVLFEFINIIHMKVYEY